MSIIQKIQMPTPHITKGDKAINIMFSTKDYGKFRLIIDGNQREATDKAVQKLKEKIRTRDLRTINPITVNRYGEIVRGQHRFLACKDLGLPVVYFCSDELAKDEIAHEHESSKVWSLKDHAKKFMTVDNPNKEAYLKLQELHEYYHIDFGGIASLLYYNYWYNSQVSRKIKDGVFELKYLADTIKFLDAVKDYHVLLGDYYRRSRFIEVFHKLYQNKQYQHKKFIAKVKKSHYAQAMQMPHSTLLDFTSILNKFYNKLMTNKIMFLGE